MKVEISKLKALKVPDHSRRRIHMTLEEGLEVIRTHRRGVPMSDIAGALGIERTSLYFRLGTWALEHAEAK